jgi:hypothetical protein
MKRLLSPIWFAFFALVLMMVSACDHDTDTFDGPSLIDRFGPFVLIDSLKASSSSADFGAGQTVYFTAKFNKRINWVVEITGQQSGAVKRITGFSSELGPDDATWDGTTTDLPLFRVEPCVAKLLIPEEDSVINNLNLNILSSRVYEGSLFANFEANSPNIVVRNFEFEFTPASGVSDLFPAGEGQKSLLLQGTDGVVDNYFVGLVEILAPITGAQFIPMPGNAPEDVYFNAFIYGTGDPYTIAIYDFYSDADGNGQYNANIDRQFTTGNIPVTWTGWRLYSLKMSELGITEAQMAQLVGMRVVLISDNNSQPTPRVQVSFATDFLTFTKNQPIKP